jgi:phosphoribosyl-ATP pyrophosphohydrolase
VARTKKKQPEKSLPTIASPSWKRLPACVQGETPVHVRPSCSLVASREWHKRKMAGEAAEVVIEAVRGERAEVIHESVDLIYNLTVLWSELGITAAEIWAEMDRRQALLRMAEKLPKEVGVGSMSSAGH